MTTDAARTPPAESQQGLVGAARDKLLNIDRAIVLPLLTITVTAASVWLWLHGQEVPTDLKDLTILMVGVWVNKVGTL